jgi:hypothetical protein
MLGSCGWPASSRIACIVAWATARWLVQAQVLSQQDNQYAQSRLGSEPLAILDQSLGQWQACDEPFGRLSTRVFKGGLTSQLRRPWHPNLLLARPQDRYEHAKSHAGSEGSFKAENDVFLLM